MTPAPRGARYEAQPVHGYEARANRAAPQLAAKDMEVRDG
jgi:hypothetical protein